MGVNAYAEEIVREEANILLKETVEEKKTAVHTVNTPAEEANIFAESETASSDLVDEGESAIEIPSTAESVANENLAVDAEPTEETIAEDEIVDAEPTEETTTEDEIADAETTEEVITEEVEEPEASAGETSREDAPELASNDAAESEQKIEAEETITEVVQAEEESEAEDLIEDSLVEEVEELTSEELEDSEETLSELGLAAQDSLESLDLATKDSESKDNTEITDSDAADEEESAIESAAPVIAMTETVKTTVAGLSDIVVTNFEQLKEVVDSAESGVEKVITLAAGIYEFTSTISISNGKSIKLLTQTDKPASNPENPDLPAPNPEAAILTRSEKMMSTMFRVLTGGKLTFGHEASPHVFAEEERTVGSVTYTEKKKTQEGQFTNNNIVVDGQGWLGDPADRVINEANNKKMDSPVVLDVKGDVEINGLEIKNITNVNRDGSASSSPIRVQGSAAQKASLTINDIDLHDNYFYTPVRDTSGGWVGSYSAYSALNVVNNAEVVMNGGSIHDNQASNSTIMVGDLYNGGDDPTAKFILNDGEIAHNKVEYTGWQFAGGVSVMPGGHFDMFGGDINNNESFHGGGVYVSSQTIETDGLSYSNTKPGGPAIFNMNGGVIRNNLAKARHVYTGSGGGIYVDSSDVTINAGQILDNTAENMGGGIYVSQVPIDFLLKNALITENKAIDTGRYLQYQGGNGGGYWHCPTGSFNFNSEDGNIIWNNTATGKGSDLYSTGKHGRFLLDGIDIADSFISKLTLFDRYNSLIKYTTENNHNYLRSAKEMAFRVEFERSTIAQALAELPVLIKGNQAQKGGGVGSNANTDFGEPEKPKHEIEVEKKWDEDVDQNNLPEEIVVDLYIGDRPYTYITLNEANAWSGKFADLDFTPADLEERLGLKYSVKEVGDEYYCEVKEERYTIDDVFHGLDQFKKIDIERIWIDNPDLGQWEQEPHAFLSQYVKVVRLDEAGNQIYTEELVELSGYKDWLNLLTYLDITSFDDILISYHGTDTMYYEPWGPNFVGFATEARDKENPHVVKIQKLNPNTGKKYEVFLPYIWAQRYGNIDYQNNFNYNDNKTGYRIEVADSDPDQAKAFIERIKSQLKHKFTLTNYEYDKILVEKVWDDTILPEDIPESITVYLTKDGKRVKDAEGNDLYVTLSAKDAWQGAFEKLKPFKLDPMHDINRYSLDENNLKFIGLVERTLEEVYDIKLERKDYPKNIYKDYYHADGRYWYSELVGQTELNDGEGYLIANDYTGGQSRIKSIPIELHIDGKVYKSEIRNHYDESILGKLYGLFKNINMNGVVPTEVKFYLDDDGKPFPRNFGQFQARKPGSFTEYETDNPGEYVFKIVEEDGKLILYMPQLEQLEGEDPIPFFDLTYKSKGETDKLILTNHYAPNHRIDITKIWSGDYKESDLPDTLKVYVQDKDGKLEEVVLTPEEWKALLKTRDGDYSLFKYDFAEEKLKKFDEQMKVNISLKVEDLKGTNKEVILRYKGEDISLEDGKIGHETLSKILASGNYKYELVKYEEASDTLIITIEQDDDGNFIIKYPTNLRLTELIEVTFENTYKPEPPKEETPPPEEEPPTPEEPTTPTKAFVTDQPPVPTKAFVQNLPPTSNAQGVKFVGKIVDLLKTAVAVFGTVTR